MAKKPLSSRRITDFCGFFIYKDGCGNSKCNRIHSRDIEKMRQYLDNYNLKTRDCKSKDDCKYFVCMGYHEGDNIALFDSTKPEEDYTEEYPVEYKGDYIEYPTTPTKPKSYNYSIPPPAPKKKQKQKQNKDNFPVMLTKKEQLKRKYLGKITAEKKILISKIKELELELSLL
jgi:hypothetical protein